MESLQHILVFAGQTLVVVAGICAILVMIAVLVARSSRTSELEIERLDKRFKKLSLRVKASTLPPKDFKKLLKSDKKNAKSPEEKPTTFVLDFKGDVKASAVENLREEVTAILGAARPHDDVLLRLESPGGMVHGYGLAASQLDRVRKAGLKLTICVDKVAASGGYMMACTANEIVAAPFAILGSIGVVAQVPNLHRLLKKHDVDYKEYTAGEFKRTVSMLGEVTEKGEEKFKEQLEETHQLFKSFVGKHRPQLDVAKVATGEYWYGEQCLSLGLIDAIATSDERLVAAAADRRVLAVKFNKKNSLNERLSGIVGRALQKAVLGTVEDLESRRWI